MNDLYKEDINKYIEYNLNDVKIVVALDEKLQFIDLARGICHTGHVGYENFGMSSRFLEGAILIYLRRKKQVAPNKSLEGRAEYENQLEQNEEGFEGAYVKDPIPGRYDWVFDLDLTSMYPNIIISLNISPETKVGKVDNWNVEEYVKNGLNSIYISGTPYTPTDFKSMLTENNLSIASNGVLYKKPEENGDMGTIPSILVKWFDERKNLRKLAKKHADAKEIAFWDKRQLVKKINLNSLYGAILNPGCRFFDKRIGQSTTLTGRSIARHMDGYLNELITGEYDHVGKAVIYGDTDSCYFSAWPVLKKEVEEGRMAWSKETCIQLYDSLAEQVNESFPGFMEQAFHCPRDMGSLIKCGRETVADRGLFITKKRYAVNAIDIEGKRLDVEGKIGKTKATGLDLKRSDTPKVIQDFLLEILNKLLGVFQRCGRHGVDSYQPHHGAVERTGSPSSHDRS